MGYWNVLVPEDDNIINYVTNPSFEIDTTGWTHSQSRAITRLSGYATDDKTSAYMRYGAFGLAVEMGSGSTEGVYFTATTGEAGTYTFSISVRGAQGVPYRIMITTTSDTIISSATFTGDGLWHRYYTTASLSASTNYRLWVAKNNSTNTATIYIDGAMFVMLNYNAWYFDGDSPKAKWIGAPHNSQSILFARCPISGKLEDLETLDFFVEDSPGAGGIVSDVKLKEYANIPGSEYTGYRDSTHSFAIVGQILGSSRLDYHSKRKKLLERLRMSGAEYRGLVYTGNGADNPLVKQALFTGEGWEYSKPNGFSERIALKAFSPDPYWYSPFTGAVSGNTFRLIGTSNYINRIIKRTNYLWDWSGTGFNGDVYCAIVERRTGDIIFGGNFTTFNGASTPYITRYNPRTGTISNMGGTSCNGKVMTIHQAPSGDIYIGGSFTIAPDGTSANRIAKSTDGTTWSALGTGADGDINSIVVSAADTVYVAGAFQYIGGVDARYLARFVAGNWLALGGNSTSSTMWVVRFDEFSQTLYAGGASTTAPTGITINRIGKYSVSGATWSAMGSGFNSTVYDILILPNSNIVACGAFNQSGDISITLGYVALWNGNTWVSMGGNFGTTQYCLHQSFDGDIYIGGQSTTVAGVSIRFAAKWTGTQWAPLDISPPTNNPSVRAIITDNYGDLYLLGTFYATTYWVDTSSLLEAHNYSTAPCYPTIRIWSVDNKNSELVYIRNNTTGATLYFNAYPITTDEILTIETIPMRRNIFSNIREHIERYLLKSSQWEYFYLVPGRNSISVYTRLTSSITEPIYVSIHWQETYTSFDGI